MQKFLSDFLFGLAFGLGLMVSYALLQALLWLLAHARAPVALVVISPMVLC